MNFVTYHLDGVVVFLNDHARSNWRDTDFFDESSYLVTNGKIYSRINPKIFLYAETTGLDCIIFKTELSFPNLP